MKYYMKMEKRKKMMKKIKIQINYLKLRKKKETES